eukprot:11184140-Lingulodinium_polyedra.AAC.1
MSVGGMPELTKAKIDPGAKSEFERDLKIPRRVRLKRVVFEERGYSARCPGCKAIVKGGRPVARSEECRKRMG